MCAAIHGSPKDYASEADAAHAFAEYLPERTGLLVPRGQNHFEWQHNSYMEFFAALYIHDQLKIADEIEKWGLDPEAPRADLEDAGFPTDSLPGALPARHAELARWAANERWREVIIFLLEYLAGPGKTAEILRHLRGIFPALHSAQPIEPNNESPLMPIEAVDLLVRIAHDSHLDFPSTIRQFWWQRLWSAYLDWPCAHCDHLDILAWPIAPCCWSGRNFASKSCRHWSPSISGNTTSRSTSTIATSSPLSTFRNSATWKFCGSYIL